MANMVEVDVASKALQKSLNKIESYVYPATKKGFEAWSRDTLNLFKGRQLSGGQGLEPRTGDLRRSFRQTVTGRDLRTVEASFFTRSKYARIHEKGGTIRPKRAKKLAIPFPEGPAVTQAGVGRYASPLRSSLPGDVNFFCKKVNGTLFLFGAAEGQEAEPWYILKDKVKIKPRLRFSKTIRGRHQRLMADLRRRYRNIFERGGRG